MSMDPDYIPRLSKSAENNKSPILGQLRRALKPGDKVLEIASGTGQHAFYFSSELPYIEWQPSDLDLEEYSLATFVAQQSLTNLLDPVVVDIANWPQLSSQFDAAYSSNCLHIIGSDLLEPYVRNVAECLLPTGQMLLYGPYKYGGEFTTPSNAEFDRFLRQTYPDGGIRDFERVDELARANGLTFVSDTAMPANNQFLIWRKQP